jgi:hypothetical protein
MMTELEALEIVSNQLAKWSLNDGPLSYNHLSNNEQRELEWLECLLEKVIDESPRIITAADETSASNRSHDESLL